VGPAHHLGGLVDGGDRRLGRGRTVATADQRCLCGSVEVGHLGLQHRRGRARLAVGKSREAAVISFEVCENVIAGRRVRKRTGDPAEPWLIASAPWLYCAWAASQGSMSVGPSSCWASHHSRGGPGDGV